MMTKVKDKHTPGKWRARTDGFRGQACVQTEINRKLFVIADAAADVAGIYPFIPIKQRRANARLMSAAPEMLSALRLAKEYLTANFGDNCAEVEEIDAALKKATGSARV